MNSLVVREYGAMTREDRDLPDLEPGNVRIRVKYAGVGFADIMAVAGKYPLAPRRPFSPGYEFFGTVESVGTEVEEVLVGQRVLGMVTKMAAYREILDIEPRWVVSVAAAFRMEEKELEWMRNHPVSKLIAAIPFLAGCEDAERTAVSHLGTYLLSIKETKRFFTARPEDSESVFERLRLISSFKGGDPRVIERGMSLLALNMVSDYRRDAEEDVFLRKYNPVSTGDFDFAATVSDLEERIEAVECPEMDEIMDLDIGPLVFWG